jgi:mRNA-degrading endonuclease RelE of RelBE toxin-antitoxin system
VSYQIKVPPEVRKEIQDLPGHVRAQARQLIRALGQNPRPARAKELRGKPNIYRIWLAGRWRMAYEIDDELK